MVRNRICLESGTGGLVGAFWTILNQERYSMQDMISQTFIASQPDSDAG